MSRVLLIALLTTALLLARPSHVCAEQTIRIVGNERLAAETVRFHLGTTLDGGYDSAKANVALKALYATGQFADVRIERDVGGIVVSVVENPLIGAITFEGNKDLDTKALQAVLGLRPGQPFSRIKADDARQHIRDAYRAKNREDVVVDVRPTQKPVNRVDLVIAITEGAVSKIEIIVFEGNHAFGDRELKDVMTVREASWFDFLRGSTAHDDKLLEDDRERLVRHYRKHGYQDVVVAAAVSARIAETGGWRITYRIDEGQRYKVGAIAFRSDVTDAPTAALEPYATLKSGETWDADAVERSIDRMTEVLVAGGTRAVEVVAQPRRDPATRTIGIDYVVRPGPRLIIERIEITGNVRTKDIVIRRELTFTEGDLYHPLLVERARKKLRALGFIKSVDIRAARGSDKDRITLVIAVVEQNSSEIGFGIGYSSTEGVTGDISFTERNLFGNGQYLKLMLAGSEKRKEAQLSFTEPYFLGRPLAAGFDLFYKDTDALQQSSYKSTRVGGTARIGFDVAENTRTTLNYTFARNTIYDVGTNASAAIKQAVPGFPNTTSAAYNTSSIGYTTTYDGRDRVSNPMQGVYVSTSQDLAGLGGDVRYLRSTVEVRGYFPLTDRVTLATRVIGGTISGWGGNEVRLLDNFYRGGETIRGFATSGIGPRDQASVNRDALGGTNYLATTAELRFPLPGISEATGLRGAVFADAGSLWGASKTAKSVNGVVGTSAALRASAGASLIWDSPLGPLRVDYAQPLAKQPFDKTQPLRFGLAPGF